MSGPPVVYMTTCTGRYGTKRPATKAQGWKYTPEWFPAGQHASWGEPGYTADVCARHTGVYELDLDLYKPDEAAAFEGSALQRYLAGRKPYVRRGDAGSVRYLVHQTPEQAAAWHPVAGKIPGGEIRSAGLAPSPGAVHEDGADIYDYVPGPDAVQYPDGTLIMTNYIEEDDELKAALIAGGARGRDDADMTAGDADLPDDDGRCPLAESWLDRADFTDATPRGTRANAAVNYLKRMDAENHRVGGIVTDVMAALPNTSEADFEGMWQTATVDAATVVEEHLCCAGWTHGEGLPGMNGNGQHAPGTNPPAIGPDAPPWTPETVNLLARVKGGAYLNTAVFAPLHFHVDGLVPEGLTVLAGAPKIGKSWLVLGWLLDLAQAGHAVLYLALEDSDRRMQWRCRRLLGEAPIPETFAYLTEEDVVPGMLLPTVAQFTGENAGRKPLIVVDTLAKACQQTPRIKDEAAYDRDYRVTSALQATVRTCPGAGLVLCHHDRKSGGEDWLDKISGTKGLTGGPDAIMLLERKRSEEAGTLRVSGRDIAEEDYAMTFADRCRWELDGGSLAMAAAAYLSRQAQAGLGDRSAGIVALAHGRGAAGIRSADVAAEFDLTAETASLYLKRLYESGRLRRPERGLYTCVCSVCLTGPPPPGTPGGTDNNTEHTQPPYRNLAADPPGGKAYPGMPQPGPAPLVTPADMHPYTVALMHKAMAQPLTPEDQAALDAGPPPERQQAGGRS